MVLGEITAGVVFQSATTKSVPRSYMLRNMFGLRQSRRNSCFDSSMPFPQLGVTWAQFLVPNLLMYSTRIRMRGRRKAPNAPRGPLYIHGIWSVTACWISLSVTSLRLPEQHPGENAGNSDTAAMHRMLASASCRQSWSGSQVTLWVAG